MRRQRPDPITNPDSFLRRTDETVFHALQPLDKTVRLMEDKWGIDRLETLVDVDTAARFGLAKCKLDEAIFQNDPELVVKRAAVMQRGWEALDRQATERGHGGVKPDAWTWRSADGTAHAFVRDVAEAHGYGSAHPGVTVWTMAEVIRIAANFEDLSKNIGSQVKQAMPGAEITALRSKLIADEIPF